MGLAVATGSDVGMAVGAGVGLAMGVPVGWTVSITDGLFVGVKEIDAVGFTVGVVVTGPDVACVY